MSKPKFRIITCKEAELMFYFKGRDGSDGEDYTDSTNCEVKR